MRKDLREEILEKHCFTDLVYGRIKKKLDNNISNQEIESLKYNAISNVEYKDINEIGKNYYLKNYYIINNLNEIRFTINKNTFRVITVDKI